MGGDLIGEGGDESLGPPLVGMCYFRYCMLFLPDVASGAMTKPVFHFSRYVRLVGGRAEASKRLGISIGMVGHIEVGRRGISPDVAKAVEADSQGAITRSDLRPDLWDAPAEAA